VEEGGRYQLAGLDALDVLVDGDSGHCLIRERVATVDLLGHGLGRGLPCGGMHWHGRVL
jgi:hypothetical protein